MLKKLKRLLLIGDHVCPWWLAYTFDNPLRPLLHNPEKLLGAFVTEGQTVLDLGCGMGYFSIGMARLVGEHGTVFAVDVQEKMLRRVQHRATKAGLNNRIQFHRATPDRIGLTEPADFALAFWMLHEVRNQEGFLNELFALLRPEGRLLLAEPKIHVKKRDFRQTVELAESLGMRLDSEPKVSLSRAALLAR